MTEALVYLTKEEIGEAFDGEFDLNVHVLGLSGSARKGSFNTALLAASKELMPEGSSLELFDISDFPLFNQDLELSPPPRIVEFKRKIREADAVLFAATEHNFSISALLKNAIEWADRPEGDSAWKGKSAAIISASTSLRGGARAQLNLRQIMADLDMYPINRPQLYVSKARDAFDSNLRLIDERHRQTLKALLGALVDWTERLSRQKGTTS